MHRWTQKSRSSCSQSDRAASFSWVVLFGGRKNFHMPGHEFLWPCSCVCASPRPSCEQIPCSLQETLHISRVAHTTERTAFDFLSTLLCKFQHVAFLLALLNKTLRNARSSELVAQIYSVCCELNFIGIADTTCRRSFFALNFSEVISSSWVVSNVLVTVTEWFRFFGSPAACVDMLDCTHSQACNFFLVSRARRWMPTTTGPFVCGRSLVFKAWHVGWVSLFRLFFLSHGWHAQIEKWRQIHSFRPDAVWRPLCLLLCDWCHATSWLNLPESTDLLLSVARNLWYFLLPWHLPLAAAAPEAGNSSCLARGEMCFSIFPIKELGSVFPVWCSPEMDPSEQYLECTATAMASAALTVEADDNWTCPEFQRLVVSSSCWWFCSIACRNTARGLFVNFIALQESFVRVADLGKLKDHSCGWPSREKALLLLCSFFNKDSCLKSPSMIFSRPVAIFLSQEPRSVSANLPCGWIWRLQLSNGLHGLNLANPNHCFCRTIRTWGNFASVLQLANPEISEIQQGFELVAFRLLFLGSGFPFTNRAQASPRELNFYWLPGDLQDMQYWKNCRVDRQAFVRCCKRSRLHPSLHFQWHRFGLVFFHAHPLQHWWRMYFISRFLWAQDNAKILCNELTQQPHLWTIDHMLRTGNCATATAQFLVNFLMKQICLLCSDSDNASLQKATDSTHVWIFQFLLLATYSLWASFWTLLHGLELLADILGDVHDFVFDVFQVQFFLDWATFCSWFLMRRLRHYSARSIDWLVEEARVCSARCSEAPIIASISAQDIYVARGNCNLNFITSCLLVLLHYSFEACLLKVLTPLLSPVYMLLSQQIVFCEVFRTSPWMVLFFLVR